MSNRQRALDALLRRDFLSFVAKVHAELDPGKRFFYAPHVEALAYSLTRVSRGKPRG